MNDNNPVFKSPIDDLPDDHPFKELGRAQQKTYSMKGRIELAKEGEAEVARLLLVDFYNRVIGKKTVPSELNEYIAHCFWRILRGEKPGAALNLTTGKNRRPPLTLNEKMDRLEMGWEVLLCMGQENLSLEEASAKVAEQLNVSQSTAEKAYKTYAAALLPKGWRRLRDNID